MTTWTKQMGFPMLSVDVVERKEDSLSLKVSQSKFSADGADEPKGAESHWLVPISFASADAPEQSRDKVEYGCMRFLN